uniref:NADH dehydrogenase subunit 4L n=1 Tax=Barbatia decussata TaxID=1508519 RepID=UPI00202959E4|nr:NADH dehydrogenase subunit 4L [Barbatia decussata]UQT66007.1 NADH dehydrogenase subunit 4L [Barbatia decussata]
MWIMECGVVMCVIFMISLGVNGLHILSVMITVECLFLSVFLLMTSFLGWFDLVPFLVLLVLSVCEAGIMLGALIRLVRTHGNDYVLSLGVQSC